MIASVLAARTAAARPASATAQRALATAAATEISSTTPVLPPASSKKNPPAKPLMQYRPLPLATILDQTQAALAALPALGATHSLVQHLLVSARHLRPHAMRVNDIESVLRAWRSKNLPIPTVAATNAIRVARIGGKSPFRALTWVSDPQTYGIVPGRADLEYLLEELAIHARNGKKTGTVGDKEEKVRVFTAALAVLALHETYALGAPSARAYARAVDACLADGSRDAHAAARTLLTEIAASKDRQSCASELQRLQFMLGEIKTPGKAKTVVTKDAKTLLEALARAVDLERVGGAANPRRVFGPVATRDVAAVVNQVRAAALKSNDPEVRKLSRAVFDKSRANRGVVFHAEVFNEKVAKQAAAEAAEVAKAGESGKK
ncbi:hypothetical protein AMAG_13513 [Allomyces macrogynus ATCC 38327]|uniref:Uncharacterized protein n=1 Tax=Allomyces macrogynus (strain ATCC 38327) TaxID=578462 RepID=A0A0L0T2P7_ALLM3|nr:hypothetical protein AMAG_13513 [Allomyces macrogynus ATCC 38327]|eukprot:KNE68874.1 hypothetical protein AMAG_13513 [Allomyces macrogynus ATCC 38327]